MLRCEGPRLARSAPSVSTQIHLSVARVSRQAVGVDEGVLEVSVAESFVGTAQRCPEVRLFWSNAARRILAAAGWDHSQGASV